MELNENENLPKAIDKKLEKGEMVQMRSELDDLPILRAVRMYWRVSTICMMAAFSAALEGYRTISSLLPKPCI